MSETNNQNSRKQRHFLMKQLIKRDFTARYKKTFLGVLWSMLSPLIHFTAQALVFSFILDRGEHYISYLITGNIVYHYFTDATSQGMHAMSGNSGIISNVNVKKDYFLFSKNLSCLFNFLLTLPIMAAILVFDGISFHWRSVFLLYPVVCLFFMNLGIGYLLSVLQVFLKDIEYFYRLLTGVLIYFSAIFYRLDRFPEAYRGLFFYNPIYPYIHFFRTVLLENALPSLPEAMFCLCYSVIFMCFGWASYRIFNNRMIYYF